MVDFLSFLTRETNFVISCLFFLTPIPCWKGVFSVKKNSPRGNEIFLFIELTPFRIGQNNFFPYIVEPSQKMTKITELSSFKMYQSPWDNTLGLKVRFEDYSHFLTWTIYLGNEGNYLTFIEVWTTLCHQQSRSIPKGFMFTLYATQYCSFFNES